MSTHALTLVVERYFGRKCGSNNDPSVIGRFYLEYLFKNKTIASMLRMDKGTETGVIATMHAFLRQTHDDLDPMDTALFGPSTSNQVHV